MKAHTDISQSKKLAEILPLESADMYYMETSCNNYTIGVIQRMEKDMLLKQAEYYKMFPCWSLAALLELLPKRIEIVDNVYELSVYLYGIYYWNINNGNLCFESKDKDNFVDACYESIVFLHEQKLL